MSATYSDAAAALVAELASARAAIDTAIATDAFVRAALEVAEAYRAQADVMAILGMVRRLADLADGGS